MGFNEAKRKLIAVQAWYVKWYFLGPDSVFISFHQ